MVRILFVCHGNICRSPMAEFIMKDLAEKSGRAEEFIIASAATSREELGNPVYPPAKQKLAEHGISCFGHTARQLTVSDYGRWDLLIGMDHANLRSMVRLFDGDRDKKCRLLLDYAGRSGQEISDPWYSGDFDAAWNDILSGCQSLLDALK